MEYSHNGRGISKMLMDEGIKDSNVKGRGI
jgi:hypothetical protein